MERLRLELSPRIVPALVDALLEALARPCELVTLEGAGGTFCEGLDLDWVLGASPAESTALLRRYGELCRRLAEMPCPVVALVGGKASGGGVALAAAADLVIATPAATFALPEVLVGLIPAMAFPWVARRTGVVRAQRLALGAAPLDAAGALAAGLVDEITGELGGELEAALDAHVARWRRCDGRALSAVKALAARYDLEDAVARGTALLFSDETRARLRRVAEGEPPWGLE